MMRIATLVGLPIVAISFEWNYGGQENWNNVPGNTCGSSSQSPINLETATATLESSIALPISWEADQSMYVVEAQTNQHTWEVAFTPLSDSAVPTLTHNGKLFALKEFSFHSPSEHTKDNNYAAMEMHMVHRAPDNQALVVAVLLDVAGEVLSEEVNAALPQTPGVIRTNRYVSENADTQAYLQEFWNTFPTSLGQVEAQVKAPYEKMLGASPTLIHYNGSFTTPPCTENTIWFVKDEVGSISQEMLDHYRGNITAVPFNQLFERYDFVPQGVSGVWDSNLGVNNRYLQGVGARTVTIYSLSFAAGPVNFWVSTVWWMSMSPWTWLIALGGGLFVIGLAMRKKLNTNKNVLQSDADSDEEEPSDLENE